MVLLRDALRDKCNNNDQADWADWADGPQMAEGRGHHLMAHFSPLSPEKNCPQSGGHRSSSPQGHTSQGTSKVGNSFSRGLAGVALTRSGVAQAVSQEVSHAVWCRTYIHIRLNY